MAKIFWVEDQSHWIDRFHDILQNGDIDDTSGNELFIFKSTEAARQHIATMKEKPDVAILDARINGFDKGGFSVSKALQDKFPGIPILFLSEHNGTDIEREALSEMMALDFISKHQKNIEEVLLWRIKAAMRHTALQNAGTTVSNSLVSGKLKMDLDTWDVYWGSNKIMNPDNSSRPLAPTPRKILRYLLEKSPRPLTPGQMAELLGVDPDRYAAATYRQHIKTLRRAIDQASGGKGEFLELCKKGYGIVTSGEEGAYIWKKPPQ